MKSVAGVKHCLVGYVTIAFLLVSSVTAVAEPYRDGDVVVFFGDSITHGGRYHEYISDYYRTRFPDAQIRFVNSGIGGDTAAGARRRIPEDVAEYSPTHVAFHFGMNDICRGSYAAVATSSDLRSRERAQQEYRRSFRGLVESVREVAPRAKFTYLTPTVYDDTAVVTNAPKTGWASVNQVGCNTGLSLMAGFVLECAAADKVEAVDWYSPLCGFLYCHQETDRHFMITNSDRVHPGKLGHSIMAWEFLKAQNVPGVVSEVEVDAAGPRSVRAVNCKVTELQCETDGVSFVLLAKALPLPVCEEAMPYVDEFKVEETLNREIVKVTGLPMRSEFCLCIDGDEVGRYSGEQFATGVRLGFNRKTPQYRQAQRVAERNAELWGREVILRNHHSARWFYGKRGAPVDDVGAFALWFERNEKDKNSYFAKFVPGYLEYWPKYAKVRDELLMDQRQTREMALPLPHRYEIRPVADAGK